MSFSQWFISFRGRIGRGRWWISIFLSLAALILIRSMSEYLLESNLNSPTARDLSSAFGLAILLLCLTAPTVKRIHDRGRSGWWLLAIPIILAPSSVAAAMLSAVRYLGFGVLAVILLIVVDLGMLAGDEGQNRFGSDPRMTEEGAMTAADYLFSFEGRVGRGRWWFGWVVLYVYIFLAMLISLPLLDLFGVSGFDAAGRHHELSLGLAFIVYLYSFLAIGAKRCHDRGRSGWFMLLWAIPYVNFWVLVELGFLRGVQGTNKFGSDPRASLTLYEDD